MIKLDISQHTYDHLEPKITTSLHIRSHHEVREVVLSTTTKYATELLLYLTIQGLLGFRSCDELIVECILLPGRVLGCRQEAVSLYSEHEFPKSGRSFIRGTFQNGITCGSP